MNNNIANSKQQKTIKCGVIGTPISHSLSPLIHNYYLNQLHISGSYDKYEIPVENFAKNLETLLKTYNLAGFNVTLPHKERIMPLCQHLSKTAKIIGAVNTVKILDNNHLYGHNSDAEGFIKNFFRHLPNYNFTDKNCLIIGAGGASRAILYGLIQQRAKNLTIANRNTDKIAKIFADFAELKLSQQLNFQHLDLTMINQNIHDYDLIINTTSLGMVNQPPLDLKITPSKKNIVICDIVYKPLFTDLLKTAKANNYNVITGIGMLIEQALVGFEMWYGKRPDYDINLEQILIKNI